MNLKIVFSQERQSLKALLEVSTWDFRKAPLKKKNRKKKEKKNRIEMKTWLDNFLDILMGYM